MAFWMKIIKSGTESLFVNKIQLGSEQFHFLKCQRQCSRQLRFQVKAEGNWFV